MQEPVSFLQSVESVDTGTQVTAVTVRLCKEPHGANLLEVDLGTGRLFSCLWYYFILCFHSGGLFTSSQYLCQQQLEAAGGREDKKESSFVNKISLCALCWKYKRTKLSFIQFKVLFLTLIPEDLKVLKVI